MSIALESSSGNRIERPGLHHGMSYGSVYDSSEAARPVAGIFAGDRRLTAMAAKDVAEERDEGADSSSTSSIGRNSDSSGGESNGDRDPDDGEVQSSYKGALDCLEALEEVLPLKRSISKFYCGKSKSFTSLSDAVSCASIKEIVKPENAYTRKRKNLLAHSTFWDKNSTYPLRSDSGNMSKRPANSARSTLGMAIATSSCEKNKKSESSSSSSSPSSAISRPPLYPNSRRPPLNESSRLQSQRSFSVWRSFSLSDLQCAAAATPSVTGLASSGGDNDKIQ
ncbi:hypothetical protein NMG60_11005627 [Bertholletia excelsa]